ncbi:hypothetical protein M0R45_016418 [Rubus argutus]|uniref:Uncharacterized protein n=1 Tax=Rubus argutus TaxID=59490 RepID=A0AAW1XT13_RUBAR
MASCMSSTSGDEGCGGMLRVVEVDQSSSLDFPLSRVDGPAVAENSSCHSADIGDPQNGSSGYQRNSSVHDPSSSDFQKVAVGAFKSPSKDPSSGAEGCRLKKRAIEAIPICHVFPLDKLRWKIEKSGSFFVRSAVSSLPFSLSSFSFLEVIVVVSYYMPISMAVDLAVKLSPQDQAFSLAGGSQCVSYKIQPTSSSYSFISNVSSM